MAGENKHPDRLTAIVSGLVAAFALAVSTYNVVLQRQQVRAQVWPHVRLSYSESDPFTLELTNSGMGPAIIKDVRVAIDGKAAKTWEDVFKRLDIKADKMGYSTMNGIVLSAGVESKVLRLFDADVAQRFLKDFVSERVVVSVCYCSVLGDCWTLNCAQSDGCVKRCPADATPFEQ